MGGGEGMEKAYQLEVDVKVSICGTSDCRCHAVRINVCTWSYLTINT
jgi:hypothetical protein